MTDYESSGPRYIENFKRYSALKAGWTYSAKKLGKLSRGLTDRLSKEVRTVAIAGSLGRLEASTESDVDYIMIVSDKNKGPANIDAMNKYLEEQGFSPPNPKGVFATARTIDELIERLGDADEPLDLLGKRLLLLLECRPVFGKEGFESCVKQVFERYARYVANEPTKDFVLLLNDLIRYFRSICVNYESSFIRENEKWTLRNIKLRHSRLIMYGGLLFLIGEASRQPSDKKIQWFLDHLSLTPLDRMAASYKASGDANFFRVAGLYNVFVARLGDRKIRSRLNTEYENRYANPTFAELKANSDALVAELMRFVFSRRGVWSDRFFEYLIW